MTFTTALAGLLAPNANAQSDYTLFESGPVRPIAMSPDGNRLFVVNTPDGYLEIFDVSSGSALKEASVPVGLEPVAVAARNDDEVWVVNHLSDSISIVDLVSVPPRVVRTLLVGDEPRGIVFAGPGGNRAFIATAHRGQNTPWPDGDYDVPGIGRADVWVFDANNLGTSLTGNPLTVVRLFGDKPRALTASPDGSKVYAAVFRSGNRTVPISEGLVCNGSGPCNVQGTTYPAGASVPGDELPRALPVAKPASSLVFNDLNGPVGRRDGQRLEPGGAVFPARPRRLRDRCQRIDARRNPEHFRVWEPSFSTWSSNPANGKGVRNQYRGQQSHSVRGGSATTLRLSDPKPSGDPASVRGNLA